MKLTELTEDLDKKQYWREHVASWRASNLSQSEYCRINGLRIYSVVLVQRELEFSII